MALKVNRSIEAKLVDALKNAQTLTEPKHRLLDPALHSQADDLSLYVATWIEGPLASALDEMRGERRTF